jgi:hypothetical protein
MKELVAYWRDQFDWRARACAQYVQPDTTTIDGLAIHFIHQRSPHPNAMPLVITQDFSSISEFAKVIGPLTDPVRYGAAPRTRSMSSPSAAGNRVHRETARGFNLRRTRPSSALMARLGYTTRTRAATWPALGVYWR